MAPTKPVPLQRAGVIAELPQVLRELDVDPAVAFAGSGIAPHGLRPDDLLPFPAVLPVFERAAALSRCPHLGLLVGSRFTLSHHGLIGALMRSAPTVHHALLEFATWQPAYSSASMVFLSRTGEDHVFGYGTIDHTAPGVAQLYDGAMAVGCRMVELLTEGRCRPTEVHFSRRSPADPSVYARVLRVPVRFGMERTCLILDEAAAGTRLPHADPVEQRRILGEMQVQLRDRLSLVSARVRHVLRPLMVAGHATMPEVAARLGLHPRTLRRRLAAEGQTFEKVRDDLRFAVARELLSMTDLPVGEIGATVGLASPGVFSETFRRWSGTAPSAWRQGARGPSGGT